MASAGGLDMATIADVVDGCPPELWSNPQRSFMMEGDFVELTAKLSVKTYIKLYLFNDCVVVARKKMWRMRQTAAYKFDCMSELTRLISGAVSIQGAPALQLSFTDSDQPLRVFSPAKNTDVRKWVAAINLSTEHQQLSGEFRTTPTPTPSAPRNRRASVFVTMEDFLGEEDRIDTQEQQLRYFERQVAIQVAEILKAPSSDSTKDRAFELRALVDSFVAAASGWFDAKSGNARTPNVDFTDLPSSPSLADSTPGPSLAAGRFARRCHTLSEAVDALLDAVAPSSQKTSTVSQASQSVPLGPGVSSSEFGSGSPSQQRSEARHHADDGKRKEASKALVVATQLVGDYLQEALRIKRGGIKDDHNDSPSGASSDQGSPDWLHRSRTRSNPAPAHLEPAPSMMGRRRSLSTSNIADIHAAQQAFQPRQSAAPTGDALPSIAGSTESLVSTHVPRPADPADGDAIQSHPASASLAAAAAQAARDRNVSRGLEGSDGDLDLETALELGPPGAQSPKRRLERSISHDESNSALVAQEVAKAAAAQRESKHRRTASSFATLKGVGLTWMSKTAAKKPGGGGMTRTASLTNLQILQKKLNRKTSDGAGGGGGAEPGRRAGLRRGESVDADEGEMMLAEAAEASEEGVEADLLSIDAEDIARQFALLDSALLQQITAVECLDCAWTKKDKAERAPNIIACIEWFNRIALFLTTEILTCETMGVRAQVMVHCITIARHCRKLNNFNALKAILTGLQCTPIFRLKKTWALVPQKARRHFEELSELMSEEANHRNYREELRRARESGSPCVPYLGIFLTDFLFTESAFAETSATDKRQTRMLAILEQFQDLQRTAVYPFNGSMRIQSFLRNAQHNTEQENYRISLEREPKETQPADDADDNAFFEALGTATHEQLLAELRRLEERLDRLYAEIATSSNKDEEEADRMWDMQRKVTQLRNLLKLKKKGPSASDEGGARTIERTVSLDESHDSLTLGAPALSLSLEDSMGTAV